MQATLKWPSQEEKRNDGILGIGGRVGGGVGGSGGGVGSGSGLGKGSGLGFGLGCGAGERHRKSKIGRYRPLLKEWFMIAPLDVWLQHPNSHGKGNVQYIRPVPTVENPANTHAPKHPSLIQDETRLYCQIHEG